MDPSIVSALSAVLGSLVGSSATIATAWITQKTQSRRELVGAEIRKRELLYSEFIDECSKLTLDALDHTRSMTARRFFTFTRFKVASGSHRPTWWLRPQIRP